MKKVVLAVALGAALVIGLSCKKSNDGLKYGVFNVKNDSTVVMNGVINGKTEKHFDLLISDHPGRLSWLYE